MSTLARSIEEFLALPRIAFVGVSRDPADFSRSVFAALRRGPRQVLPVNPAATEIDGVPVVAHLRDLDPPPDGVLVMTPPAATAEVIRECAHIGIRRVWLYRGLGPGAVSDAALRACEEANLDVVPGECPLMFLPDSAGVHQLHARLRAFAGTLPGHPRPADGLVWALAGVQGFVGLGAVAGGIGLMTDPSGATMSLPLEWLDGSPFRDYLVPGLTLFLVNGVLSLLTAGCSLRRWRAAPEAGLALGAFLMAWIGVQVAVIGLSSPLQAAFFGLGALEFALARRWLAVRREPH
jgi:uncharacterized protein